jgi:hypothetical protein
MRVEELRGLYSSQNSSIIINQIKDEREGWWDVQWGQERSAQIFGGEIEGKKPLGWLRVTLEDTIKMSLKETETAVVEWTHFA